MNLPHPIKRNSPDQYLTILMNCYKKLTTHHKEGVAKDDTNNVHSLIGLIKGVNTQVGQSDHVTKTNWQGLITLDTIVG